MSIQLKARPLDRHDVFKSRSQSRQVATLCEENVKDLGTVLSGVAG